MTVHRTDEACTWTHSTDTHLTAVSGLGSDSRSPETCNQSHLLDSEKLADNKKLFFLEAALQPAL